MICIKVGTYSPSLSSGFLNLVFSSKSLMSIFCIGLIKDGWIAIPTFYDNISILSKTLFFNNADSSGLK